MCNKPILPDPLPEWFLSSGEKALFNTKDTARIFGMTSIEALSGSMAAGCFPRPDFVVNASSGRLTKYKEVCHGGTRSLWTKKTIIKEHKRRTKIHQEQE